MSPAEVRNLTNVEILEMLVSLKSGSDEAVSWLAAVIASPALVEGVSELSRRYRCTAGVEPVATAAGRHPHARTVHLDVARWKSFFWRRRMTLTEVGGLFGRGDAWASVMANRGRAGFYALDELACALDMHVDDLINEVGTDDERARLAICV